ncbi:MAG: PAS domain-containing protein [Dehalococcoidia bacterium]|nr:PAS domain-containing protein [Dehalococcoidia bacterium]
MYENLTHEQLSALLDALPMELAFIDAEDNVRFWNRAADRGPAWAPSVLGGPVQQCHRPTSVAAVNRVLEKLKSGSRDVVDRRVTTEKGVTRFRWFAVKNEAGDYLGTLEMVQYASEVASENRPAGQARSDAPDAVFSYSSAQVNEQ